MENYTKLYSPSGKAVVEEGAKQASTTNNPARVRGWQVCASNHEYPTIVVSIINLNLMVVGAYRIEIEAEWCRLQESRTSVHNQVLPQ